MPGPNCDKCKDKCQDCNCGDNCKCAESCGCGDKCGCKSGSTTECKCNPCECK